METFSDETDVEQEIRALKRRIHQLEEEDPDEREPFLIDEDKERYVIHNLTYFRKRRKDEQSLSYEMIRKTPASSLMRFLSFFQEAIPSIRKNHFLKFLRDFPMLKTKDEDLLWRRMEELRRYALTQEDDESRRLYKKLKNKYHFKFPEREPLRMPPPLD